MIYIYCPRRSNGARTLVNKIRELGGQARRVREHVGGCFVWGVGGGNKFNELCRLFQAGVPVPRTFVSPIPPQDVVLLGRTFRHTQARDLLNPGRAEFWVEKINTVREHRIHIFDGGCIRVQTKQPTGERIHPWIRSASSGWTLVARPDLTALVPRGARTIAKRAVEVLGYEFGAVDIGVKPDGDVVVWEVNTQPGLGDGTADVYARILMEKYGG